VNSRGDAVALAEIGDNNRGESMHLADADLFPEALALKEVRAFVREREYLDVAF
jgi:hypothetical protein